MNSRDLIITVFSAMLATPCVMFMLQNAGAQVRESTNYSIQADSVNFGGGLSDSASHTLDSTMGEVATGDATSTSYTLRAGYQQMTGSYIALSAPANVALLPSLPGVTGGISNGSTTVTVTTDSAAGYSLSISAVSSPAMTSGGDSIADYAPLAADPDFSFTTDAIDAHLGYSPEGVDITSRFRDNSSSCGIGASDTALSCWDGLSLSDELIAESDGANTPSGATTTINFRVGLGTGVVQAVGTYTATTTLTVLPQ